MYGDIKKHPIYVAYDIYMAYTIHIPYIFACIPYTHTHIWYIHGPARLYVDTHGTDVWREGKEKSSCSPNFKAWPPQAPGQMSLSDLVEQKMFLSVGSAVAEHSSRHFQPFHILQ